MYLSFLYQIRWLQRGIALCFAVGGVALIAVRGRLDGAVFVAVGVAIWVLQHFIARDVRRTDRNPDDTVS